MSEVKVFFKEKLIIFENNKFEKFENIITEVKANLPYKQLDRKQNSFFLNLNEFTFICVRLPYSEIYKFDSTCSNILKIQKRNYEFLKSGHKNTELFGKEWVEKNQNIVVDLQKKLKEAGFKRDLLEHQLKDLYQMSSVPNAANFSVPGSGKTSVILGIYSLRSSEGPLIVFVPNKGVAESWEDEVDKCFQDSNKPEFKQLQGPYKNLESELKSLNKNSIAVMTYRLTISRGVKEVLFEFFKNSNNAYVVLDESHRIKGGIKKGFAKPSQQGEVLISLSKFIDRKDLLSGTPVTKDIYDFVSQIEFLYPALGFTQRLIENQANPRPVVNNLMTRTFKKELPLPQTIDHKPIPSEMSQAQSAFYALTVNKYKDVFRKRPSREVFNKVNKAIVRLIELSTDPHNVAQKILSQPQGESFGELISQNRLARNALNELIKEEEVVSNKMKTAIEKGIDITSSGEKVIIWSYFTNSINVMEKYIREHYDITPLVLMGGVANEKDVIRDFNRKNDKLLLLANPEKGSEGISLHENCNNAIYLSRTYKAGQYLQSRDRIHRVGMNIDKNVNYYFIESVYGEQDYIPTIDRRISENLQRKIEDLAIIFNDPELLAVSSFEEEGEELNSDFTEEDIDDFIEMLLDKDYSSD